MPARRRSPGLDVLVRSSRFLYLLWGGMLLASGGIFGSLRLPEFVWRAPGFAHFLLGAWGRGLLLGLGITMALAALFEMWELVDLLLARFLHDHEH